MPVTCSRWSWDRLDYDYFLCPGRQSPGGWGPVEPATGPPRPPRDPVGFDIDELLPALPAGCRHVGRGVQALGRVVRPAKRPLEDVIGGGGGVSPAGGAAFGGFGAVVPPGFALPEASPPAEAGNGIGRWLAAGAAALALALAFRPAAKRR